MILQEESRARQPSYVIQKHKRLCGRLYSCTVEEHQATWKNTRRSLLRGGVGKGCGEKGRGRNSGSAPPHFLAMLHLVLPLPLAQRLCARQK